MSGYKGYYSLIQFCPNPSRAEAVNVGVLLFCPELHFIDAQVSRNTTRARRLLEHEEVDVARLKTTQKSIKERMLVEHDRFRTLEDLNQFIGTRGNDIQLTSPRTLRVLEPVKQLGELFRELVEVEGKPANYRAALTERLRSRLEVPALEGKLERDKKITLPVVEREIKIPFAYRNGVTNLILPAHFSTGADGIHKAMRIAFEAELVKKIPPNGTSGHALQVVVDTEDSKEGREIEALVIRIIETNGEAVSARDLDSFVQKVIQQAH